MANEAKQAEYQDALGRAQGHRQKADDLQKLHSQEPDETKREILLSQAKEEKEKAEASDRRAKEILEQGESGQNPKQDGQAQSDPTANPSKRTWYEPGSVADDVMQQVSEASQDSIINNVLKYAARSVFDKDHREFEGAKMLKNLAKAPVDAYKGAQSAARSFQGRQQSENRTEGAQARSKEPNQTRKHEHDRGGR